MRPNQLGPGLPLRAALDWRVPDDVPHGAAEGASAQWCAPRKSKSLSLAGAGGCRQGTVPAICAERGTRRECIRKRVNTFSAPRCTINIESAIDDYTHTLAHVLPDWLFWQLPLKSSYKHEQLIWLHSCIVCRRDGDAQQARHGRSDASQETPGRWSWGCGPEGGLPSRHCSPPRQLHVRSPEISRRGQRPRLTRVLLSHRHLSGSGGASQPQPVHTSGSGSGEQDVPLFPDDPQSVRVTSPLS